MFKVNGTEYRNLQEQVLKNKQDIAKHYEIDRALANLGIKVVGRVDYASLLPNPLEYDGNYGDTFAVGVSEPYDFYVYSRPDINAGDTENHWLNVGSISIVGPQGPQGIQGIQGPQGIPGTSWTTYNIATAALPKGERTEGDLNVNPVSGDISKYTNGVWTLAGNIKGPQGLTGQQGPQGPQGIQGPQGVPGPQGPAGQSFYIAGTLSSQAQLPDPTTVDRGGGYLIGSTSTGYELYVVTGTTELLWSNVGSIVGVAGPQGPTGATGAQGPTGPAGATGAVGLTWRGEWDSGTTYEERDMVTHMNNVYYSLSTNEGFDPSIYSEYWELLIESPPQIKQRLASYQVPTPSTGYFNQATPNGYIWKGAISSLPAELYDNLHAIYVEGYLFDGAFNFAFTLIPRRVPASGNVQFISNAPMFCMLSNAYELGYEQPFMLAQLPMLTMRVEKEDYPDELALELVLYGYGRQTTQFSTLPRFGFDSEGYLSNASGSVPSPIFSNINDVNKVYLTRIDIIYQTND